MVLLLVVNTYVFTTELLNLLTDFLMLLLNRQLQLIIKITHMWRRCDTPQNFFLAFIDEFEKQVIIKKTVEVGQ